MSCGQGIMQSGAIQGRLRASGRMLQRRIRNCCAVRCEGIGGTFLAAAGITLLVTREYEHLVMAMRVTETGKPAVSYFRLPHPSGLVVDRDRNIVHLASTRNPNQVYEFMPVSNTLSRLDMKAAPLSERPLVPVRSRFFPGCLYMHDLAIIGGQLHANSVGQKCHRAFR